MPDRVHRVDGTGRFDAVVLFGSGHYDGTRQATSIDQGMQRVPSLP